MTKALQRTRQPATAVETRRFRSVFAPRHLETQHRLCLFILGDNGHADNSILSLQEKEEVCVI